LDGTARGFDNNNSKINHPSHRDEDGAVFHRRHVESLCVCWVCGGATQRLGRHERKYRVRTLGACSASHNGGGGRGEKEDRVPSKVSSAKKKKKRRLSFFFPSITDLPHSTLPILNCHTLL
jgi:hypothetical protein